MQLKHREVAFVLPQTLPKLQRTEEGNLCFFRAFRFFFPISKALPLPGERREAASSLCPARCPALGARDVPKALPSGGRGCGAPRRCGAATAGSPPCLGPPRAAPDLFN